MLTLHVKSVDQITHNLRDLFMKDFSGNIDFADVIDKRMIARDSAEGSFELLHGRLDIHEFDSLQRALDIEPTALLTKLASSVSSDVVCIIDDNTDEHYIVTNSSEVTYAMNRQLNKLYQKHC